MTQQDLRAPFTGTLPPRLTATPSFVSSVARDWQTVSTPADVVDGAGAAAARHRARLGAALPGSTVVAYSGTAPVRNDDCRYAFRADSTFVWLTGCQAENATLVMRPAGDGHDATLYLDPPFRPGATGFFADSNHGELWTGPAAGLPEWRDALGLDVRPASELDDAASRPAGALATRAVPDHQVRHLGLVASAELEQAVAALRAVKDEWEIAQLRAAVDATVDGFAAVAAELPGVLDRPRGERWLQGTFDRHARTAGNGPGYATIVGAGPHSPVLHWTRCDGTVHADDVLLLDMGVEAHSLYTADVTRTLPASGTFDPVQRQVHDLVERAHRAGLDRVRPGARFSDFHFAAMEVVATGLHDWGVLPVSVDEALSPGGQQHRRYLVCGIGHHLGLDVHDCSATDYASGMDAPLQPGMVLTVEPGLYFHANDGTVPPELRGIGVRLEDDVLVTATGSEVLSTALPIEAASVEAWTRSYAGPWPG